MELTISACPRDGVRELKEKLIDLCVNNAFGGWSYRTFSLVEEAICKSIQEDGHSGFVVFIIEEKDESLIMTPAKIKGEVNLPFNLFSACVGRIVNLLMEKLWDSVSEITVRKNYLL